MSWFWRPLRGAKLKQLWYRCDSCYWSGDPERFIELFNDRGDSAQVCTHSWCWTEKNQAEYRLLGWQWLMEA